MVPYNYTEFIDGLTSLVKNKFIPISRIDDAVARILRVKFTMGLFERPLADYSLSKYLGSQVSWKLEQNLLIAHYSIKQCVVSCYLANFWQEHRELAREAVRKSLVLLKNGESADEPLIPLPKKASKILVAGTHADNLGYQCGGWTIEWQGLSGNITVGKTTNHSHLVFHFIQFSKRLWFQLSLTYDQAPQSWLLSRTQ